MSFFSLPSFPYLPHLFSFGNSLSTAATSLSRYACQAWFKHAEPHPLWGIFPRLAYEMFKDKTDGWKITMKYFQNVVDTVRWGKEEQVQTQRAKNDYEAVVCSGCRDNVLAMYEVLRIVTAWFRWFVLINVRSIILRADP